MDWLSRIYNSIVEYFTGSSTNTSVAVSVGKKQPLFNGSGKTTKPNEITMTSEMSESQAEIQQAREKYLTTTPAKTYKVKNGDNLETIAEKHGVEVCSIMAANGITEANKNKLKLNQTLKIPAGRQIKPGSVRTLNDIAKSMGVSVDFVKRLKRIEDGADYSDNQFHTTPYEDKAGVLTIGIGHALKPGDPRSLTNAQVTELCAKDLLKMEENLCVLLGGRKNYDKLPQNMKEALLDMTFNKGTEIFDKTPGLLYCLKQGKYEAAINKFTHNRAMKTDKEMSGLSKRRLFDISIATKMYNGKIPQSNLNTAQAVYNRGIELLRQECKAQGLEFEAQLEGYNKDVKSYLGNNISYIQK